MKKKRLDDDSFFFSESIIQSSASRLDEVAFQQKILQSKMVNFVVTGISNAKNIDGDGIITIKETQSLKELLQERSVSIRGDVKWLSEGKSFDIYVDCDNKELLKIAVTEIENKFEGIDLIIQEDDEFRKNKKLFVFDMDSTLIYQEVIEMIAAYADVEPQVKEITDRAMNNEIDFAQSLRERVALLRGIRTQHLYDEIKPRLNITNGVRELSRALKKTGCKLAVLSGGFVPFANHIKEQLAFDFALANTLGVEVIDGHEQLNGFALGDIVDGQRKAITLVSLAQEYGVPIESTVMVGDGGNDLLAMAAAGFGIAWNAKPKVQELAPCKLNSDNMLDVLYILGYTEEEIKSLLD